MEPDGTRGLRRRISPFAAAVTVIAALFVLAILQRLFAGVPKDFAFWLVILLAAAPGLWLAFAGALTPVYPAVTFLESLRPAIGAWVVSGLVAMILGYQSGSEYRSNPVMYGHSLGTLAGLCAIALGLVVVAIRTRDARRRFADAVRSGDARPPVLGPWLRVTDRGTGAVPVSRGRRLE